MGYLPYTFYPLFVLFDSRHFCGFLDSAAFLASKVQSQSCDWVLMSRIPATNSRWRFLNPG